MSPEWKSDPAAPETVAPTCRKPDTTNGGEAHVAKRTHRASIYFFEACHSSEFVPHLVPKQQQNTLRESAAAHHEGTRAHRQSTPTPHHSISSLSVPNLLSGSRIVILKSHWASHIDFGGNHSQINGRSGLPLSFSHRPYPFRCRLWLQDVGVCSGKKTCVLKLAIHP